MRLYHGTTKKSYKKILDSGKINKRVYLSPDDDIAKDYAFNNSDQIVLIFLDIDESELKADYEFVKGECEDFLEESLNNGSCYVNRNIKVSEFVSVKEFSNK